MHDLGNASLERILDVDPFALKLNFLFPGAAIGALEQARPLLEPYHVDFSNECVLLGVQSFLLHVGGLLILLDTCVGEHKERLRRPDWHLRSATGYLERLSSAGARPDDIDVVLCTHLHADHVGWNTKLEGDRWVPTFPKARYLIGRTELDHWQAEERVAPGVHNHNSLVDSVIPILEAGQCEIVDDGFALAEGLSILALPGHSPGQVGVTLDRGSGREVIFCGDAIHSPAQVFEPGWTSPFCSDPAQAVRTRTALLERSAENGSILAPAHLRHAWGMRIERRGTRWFPVFV